MSGLVVLAGGEGAGDPGLLERLTGDLAFRGPDGRSTWADTFVGMGQTLLATDPGVRPASGPAWPDGRAGDACVDTRGPLRLVHDARLDRRRAPEASDAGLILRAHARRGDAAPRHLHGDFAYVVWDCRERRLVAARDRFGVKPLYWAEIPGGLVISNTLRTILAHPAVAVDVDEAAVGDYLLYGMNLRPDRTSFAAVRRVPPGHLLRWRPGQAPRTLRYWTLPVVDVLRLADAREYPEALREALDRAVADRLPRDADAAVLMSGGLDSTSVAAAAADLRRRRGDDAGLEAVTFVYEGMAGDHEGRYAALVAEAAGMPLREVALDDEEITDLWEAPGLAPEPTEHPVTARTVAALRRAAPHTRVGLTGHGGDAAFHLSPPDFLHHARSSSPLATALSFWRYRRRHGHLPRVGLRTGLKRWLEADRRRRARPFPPWISADLERRHELRDRWESLPLPEPRPGALRPFAHGDLQGPGWTAVFEGLDAGVTGCAAEMRHPFFDLRLVELALALPPVPWCVEKEILREAMRGRLPDAVLRRRKAALAGYPAHAMLARDDRGWLDEALSTPDLDRFLDVDRFARIAGRRGGLRPSEYTLVTRPLGLARWMRQVVQPALAHRRRRR